MAKRKKRKSKNFFTIIFLIVAFLIFAYARFFPNEFEKLRSYIENSYLYFDKNLSDFKQNSDNFNIEKLGNFEAESYLPISSKNLQILRNIAYVSAFSNEDAIPHWVVYLVKYPFAFEASKRPSKFSSDPRVIISPEHSDYTNSGFDRGHLAPNYAIARSFGQKAQKETFLMTNIVPQTSKMNSGIWCDIEQYVANKVAKRYGKVLVFAGPVLSENPKKIRGKVAIPVSCYMIIFCQRSYKEFDIAAFVVPQNPTKKSIWDYSVSVDTIEALTGIDFLYQLEDSLENRLESTPRRLPF